MKVVKYTTKNEKIWNDFVVNSKNTHFFFQRSYMEYHIDRFQDHSLIFFEYDKVVAVLPANLKNQILYSHQGLTFGGLIVGESMKMETMLNIFTVLRQYLLQKKIEKLIYKCIPYIYYVKPADEDRYALFRNGAKLIRRDVSATIDLQYKIDYQEQRKRAIKKAAKNGLVCKKSNNFTEYWSLLETILKTRYKSLPVHSLEEIQKLALLFPENIKLFVAKKDNKILAGTVVYENPQIVHTQYLANSIEGKKLGALDLVIDTLINEVYCDKKYFDFGISTENDGKFLNTGLISQKEGFGARAVVHDFYEWKIL